MEPKGLIRVILQHTMKSRCHIVSWQYNARKEQRTNGKAKTQYSGRSTQFTTGYCFQRPAKVILRVMTPSAVQQYKFKQKPHSSVRQEVNQLFNFNKGRHATDSTRTAFWHKGTCTKFSRAEVEKKYFDIFTKSIRLVTQNNFKL